MRRVIDRCSINDARLVATVPSAESPRSRFFASTSSLFFASFPLEWSKKLRLKRLHHPASLIRESWKSRNRVLKIPATFDLHFEWMKKIVTIIVSWNRLSPVLHLSLLRLSQQRQSCDKLFRKRKRKKTTRPVVNRSSFLRLVSIYSKVFAAQNGSQVDLTLRAIAHTFEQGTAQKVRHLFMARPANFDIVDSFFSFVPCIVYNYYSIFRSKTLFFDQLHLQRKTI